MLYGLFNESWWSVIFIMIMVWFFFHHLHYSPCATLSCFYCNSTSEFTVYLKPYPPLFCFPSRLSSYTIGSKTNPRLQYWAYCRPWRIGAWGSRTWDVSLNGSLLIGTYQWTSHWANLVRILNPSFLEFCILLNTLILETGEEKKKWKEKGLIQWSNQRRNHKFKLK